MPESPLDLPPFGARVQRAEDEVATICQNLLRIDSSNYGDGSGAGERAAAEQVAALLAEVDFEPECSSPLLVGPPW